MRLPAGARGHGALGHDRIYGNPLDFVQDAPGSYVMSATNLA